MKLEAGNKSNYTSFRWGTPGPGPSALGGLHRASPLGLLDQSVTSGLFSLF